MGQVWESEFPQQFVVSPGTYRANPENAKIQRARECTLSLAPHERSKKGQFGEQEYLESIAGIFPLRISRQSVTYAFFAVSPRILEVE